MRPIVRMLSLALVVAVLAACRGDDDPGSRSPSQEPEPHWLDATPAAASTIRPPNFEALPGAKAYFGILEHASYRIEIPSRWNGDLLLWVHGTQGFGPEAYVDGPPPALRRELIEQGFAWAASSFSENGYVPGLGTNDTLALKRYFVEKFQKPGNTYIAGNSLGGNIVVLSLENFPEEYDGGLAFCGAVAGEEYVDYLLAWAMVSEAIAGHQLPLEQGQARVTEVLNSSILPAFGPVGSPTAKGEAFESVIRHLTGGARPFFTEGYRESYLINWGLVTGDPGRVLPMTRGATNVGVEYRIDPGFGFDGGSLNQSVRRIPADPSVRDAATHPDTAPTTGQLRAPLLTLHETGDLAVPISMEQSYRKKAESAGSGNLLVQRVIRNGAHCEFSDDEMTRAWSDLVGWVEHGKKPAGDDVLGDLSDAGLTFTNPLRPNDPGAK